MNQAEALLPHSTTPELDVRLLREHAAGDEALLASLIARRAAGEPVAQIVGSKGFWTLELFVSKDVLTPRPDSETMIDALLCHRPDTQAALRVVDVGTGSGCLLLAALSEYPHAQGMGLDISEAALSVACRNVEQFESGTEKKRIQLMHSEYFSALDAQEKFDVILTNPPYIPTHEIATLDVDVKAYEPHLALDGGEDGLDCYRALALQMKSRMVERGIALIEVGAGQSEAVAAMFVDTGLTLLEIRNDLAGIDRIVVLSNQP